MNQLSNAERAHSSCYLTYAALAWLINGLHSRPDDTSTGRAIVRAALPLTMDLQDVHLYTQGQVAETLVTSDGIPYAPCGILYLRRMFVPPEANKVRLHHGPALDDNVFRRIFGKSLGELTMQHNATGFRTRGSLPAKRYPMVKGLTKKRAHNEEQEATFPELNHIIVASEVPDYGPDEEQHAPPLDGEHQLDTGILLDALWQQFATDIIQKIGNPQDVHEASYCHLTRGTRQNITIDDINTQYIGSIFTKVQWKVASYLEWNKVFDYLWPSSSHTTPLAAQHYPTMNYYRDWKHLIHKVTCDQEQKLRQAVKQLFATLLWIPAATSDRVWVYKVGDEEWSTLPTGGKKGPRILWSPTTHLMPKIVHPQAIVNVDALREEEEEDSN